MLEEMLLVSFGLVPGLTNISCEHRELPCKISNHAAKPADGDAAQTTRTRKSGSSGVGGESGEKRVQVRTEQRGRSKMKF